MPIVADRRLYLTRDKLRVVEEGDPEMGYLFVAPGHVISDTDANKFGLDVGYEPKSEPEVKPADEVESKMSDDIEDKMVEVSENKTTKRRRGRKSKD